MLYQLYILDERVYKKLSSEDPYPAQLFAIRTLLCILDSQI